MKPNRYIAIPANLKEMQKQLAGKYKVQTHEFYARNMVEAEKFAEYELAGDEWLVLPSMN